VAETNNSGVLILLPTTGNRIPQLRLSIASVRQQTHANWKLVVIGDGIDDDTEKFLLDIAADDARIECRSFEKSERRGEDHRHRLIQSVDSDDFPFIAYLCDRDLWFPDHLALGLRALGAESLGFFAAQGWSMLASGEIYPVQNPVFMWTMPTGIKGNAEYHFPLSSVIHTRRIYDQSEGWSETPVGMPTDVYMWRKLLRLPRAKVLSHPMPSFCFFRSMEHRSSQWKSHEPIAQQALTQMQADFEEYRLNLHNAHLARVQAQWTAWNRKFMWFYRGNHNLLQKIFFRWPGFGRPDDFPG